MTSLTALVCAMSLGGCGPGGCAPAAAYQWRNYAGDPERSYLFYNGVQVGGYDHRHGIYRGYDAGLDRWGPPESPPWHDDRVAREDVPNFGVDTDKLNGTHHESYRLNGVSISHDEAREALIGNAIPNDAQRFRLTVIGQPGQTKRVVEDLASAPALDEWKSKLVAQAYPPDHWSVARAGFVTSGQPTIYLQAPDGKVLHRQDDYDDGPDGLARALRRADPNYDSKKDPDLRKLPFRPRIDWSALPMPALLLVAGVIWLWVRRR